MKTTQIKLLIFLILSGLFIVSPKLLAQVTIGSEEEAVSGALLDLKQDASTGKNANKGLILPRVNLNGVQDPQLGTDAETDKINFAGEEVIHTGLTVYNLTDNTASETDINKQLCPGPYVWNGKAWERLWGPCSSGCLDCTSLLPLNVKNGDILTNTEIEIDALSLGSVNKITIRAGQIVGTYGSAPNTIIVKTPGTSPADDQVINSTNRTIKLIVNGKITSSIPFSIPLSIPGFDNCASCQLPILVGGGTTPPVSGSLNCDALSSTTNKIHISANTPIFTSGKISITELASPITLNAGTLLGSGKGLIISTKNTVTIPQLTTSDPNFVLDIIISGQTSETTDFDIPIHIPGTSGANCNVYFQLSKIKIDCSSTEKISVASNTPTSKNTSLTFIIPAGTSYFITAGTIIGSANGINVIANESKQLTDKDNKIKVLISGTTTQSSSFDIDLNLLPNVESCKITIDIISFLGKINCDNNISNIKIGVCQVLNKRGSFQLTVFGNTIIKITDGDILGQNGDYKIIAKKMVSDPNDVNYYEVTSINSPADINVAIVGPNPPTAQTNTTIKIPIEFKNVANEKIDGCPYSIIEILDDYTIIEPISLLFTSGFDGLSRGYQAFKDQYGWFNPFQNGGNPPILPSYIMNEYLVRPWGIKGISFQEQAPLGSRTGTVKGDTQYWPLSIKWKPTTAKVKVVSIVGTDRYKEPKIQLKYENKNLPITGTASDCLNEPYAYYQITDTQTSPTNLVWQDFITVSPINEAPIFAENKQVFRSTLPIALRKKIQIIPETGTPVEFDIRQINYGILILDKYDNEVSRDEIGIFNIYNWDPLVNNWEYTFKIISNAKWKCVGIECGILGEPNLIESVNLSTDRGNPMTYGPEEDLFGEPRERTITLKFDPNKPLNKGSFIDIIIELQDAKFVNDSWSGKQDLVIHLWR